MIVSSALLPRIPPHFQFYEDVSSHPSDHLLLSSNTPLFWKTKDLERESSQDEELTFAGVTGRLLRGQPNPSCPNECKLKQVSYEDRLPLDDWRWRFATDVLLLQHFVLVLTAFLFTNSKYDICQL